jgi:hypothetical protein
MMHLLSHLTWAGLVLREKEGKPLFPEGFYPSLFPKDHDKLQELKKTSKGTLSLTRQEGRALRFVQRGFSGRWARLWSYQGMHGEGLGFWCLLYWLDLDVVPSLEASLEPGIHQCQVTVRCSKYSEYREG